MEVLRITGVLIKSLHDVFNMEDYSIESSYYGKSINITGIETDTYVYLRVYHRRDVDDIRKLTVDIDISSINLDESIQRRGYFTALITRLKSLEFVNNIIVSSVLTDEMRNACIKNNLIENSMYNGYSLK